eukprot:scaffold16827_cov130-Amphora_coffeaeformis.AAC.1
MMCCCCSCKGFVVVVSYGREYGSAAYTEARLAVNEEVVVEKKTSRRSLSDETFERTTRGHILRECALFRLLGENFQNLTQK